MRVGVIDIGTNSVRVLVTDSPGVADLARDLTITRLGEGVDAARVLGVVPQARTAEAIAAYATVCADHGCERVRLFATSAVRDAANRDEFMDLVESKTGLRIDLLSGDEEARLGFSGAVAGLEAPAPRLVVDIGGGSTELVRGAEQPQRFVSMDIGSVRLTERHVRNDPPRADELEALVADADAALDAAVTVVGAEPPATLVGLAGTITTMAAIALGLSGYDRDAIHRVRMSLATVDEIAARLASMTSEQRRSLPAMPRGREDVIVGGAVILRRVMLRFAAAEVLVSESDILDGAALALARD